MHNNSFQNDIFLAFHECIKEFHLIEEITGVVSTNDEIKLKEIMPFAIPCIDRKVLFYRDTFDNKSGNSMLTSQFLKVLKLENILNQKAIIDFHLYRKVDNSLAYRVKLLNAEPHTIIASTLASRPEKNSKR